jgi:hypothetical protein
MLTVPGYLSLIVNPTVPSKKVVKTMKAVVAVDFNISFNFDYETI